MDAMKRTRRRSGPPDLTVVAIPFYFGSMAVEYLWLRRRPEQSGPTAGDYERRDTVASLPWGWGVSWRPSSHRSCSVP